jgi:hypothetical protein
LVGSLAYCQSLWRSEVDWRSGSGGATLARQVHETRREMAMKLSIKVQLKYGFPDETQIIASIEAAHSSDQKIMSETLNVQPPIQLLRDEMSLGRPRLLTARGSGCYGAS